MKNNRVRRIFFIMFLLLVCGGVRAGFAQTISDYNASPVFTSPELQANVMIMLDTSMSMFKFAYYEGWETPKDLTDDNYGTNNGHPAEGFNPSTPPATNYYGLFDSRYWYTYGSNKFTPSALRTSRAKTAAEWDGDFLNWLTMRRIDVLRKVLTGGKESGSTVVPETPSSACAEGSEGAFKRVVLHAHNYGPFTDDQVDFKIFKDGIEKISGTTGEYSINIVKVSGTTTEGILQRLYDRFRWGLTFFNTDNEGGQVTDPTKERNLTTIRTSLVNNVNTVTPTGKTPLAESLWTITGYFAQTTGSIQGYGSPGPSYSSDYVTNNENDPYNYGTGGQPIWAPCARTAVILITAGEPCEDGNLPSGLQNYAVGTTYDCTARSDIGTDDCYFYNCGTGAVPGVEDVALFAHTNDIRSSLTGDQKIDFYVVSVFGSGATLLKWTAINGGFIDQDDDNLPDGPDEYDVDPDIGTAGEPDNYFEARNGNELDAALQKTAELILKKVASGTGVAVLSTSATGEGSLFQAYFRPKETHLGADVYWLGYLQGLWVDKYGNLREDTVNDHALVPAEDKIIQYVIEDNEPKVERYSDTDGDGVPNTIYDDKVPLSTLQPIWEGGKLLAQRTASTRTIKTFKDADNDGLVDTGEFIDFTTSAASGLQNYLRAADATEAANIISFIRGETVTGYRNRNYNIGGTSYVWKLGDIVYSTPTVSSVPTGNYHVYYGDTTYTPYYQKYIDREVIVCAGANDGMLHAFWAGKYNAGNNPSTSPTTEECWYQDTRDDLNLGDEIWAYIPGNLLPHLKWLKDTTYGTSSTHVFYVDLKPRVADVKIFTDDGPLGVHPGGWGTVLIGGMRLGGGPINGTGSLASRTFRSAYFALDITDPTDPDLLWEFTDADLGYTSSYPAVAKVGTKWFAIFGSGPTGLARADCDNTGKNGKIYIVDIATGTASQTFTTTDSGAFFSDPIAIDTQLDYDVDICYFGETYDAGTTYGGKIYRLWTKNSSGVVSEDPTQWVSPSVFFTTGTDQAITSSPAASFDDAHTLWVYFGTGKFMGTIDKTSSYQQTFYGIKEPCSLSTCTTAVVNDRASPATPPSLFNATDVVVRETGGVVSVEGLSGVTTWDQLVLRAGSYSGGWFRNLWWNSGAAPSERVISRPVVFGGITLFSTFIPNSDVCGFGGNSYLFALNYMTGTANRIPAIGKSGTEILAKESLGPGMASGVALHVITVESGGVGDDIEKAYVQMSTGAIIAKDVETQNQQAGIASWREKR